MPLLARCFVCCAELPRRERLSSLDVGEKVAFDPRRGRLWIVCTMCGAWNLVPLELRWEVVEELERIVHDKQARLLAQTDNIALLDARDLMLVRVGRTQRKEEAWWRYLKEAEARAQNAKRVVKRGKWKDAGWSFLLFGLPIPGWTPSETWIERARASSFGVEAWQGWATCDVCGTMSHTLWYRDPIVLIGGSNPAVRAACKHCAQRKSAGSYELPSPLGARVAQRALAYSNYTGGSWLELNEAVQLIDDARDSAHFLDHALSDRIYLQKRTRTERLALEMALNESKERELLELELADLEERWKAEEEIAFIIDRELTPP